MSRACDKGGVDDAEGPVRTPAREAYIARIRAKIDAAQIEELAACSLTVAEIAAVCGCHVRTIQRRCAAALEKGRLRCDASLRRRQYELAVGGNVTMLIWLGKQRLGQRDRVEQTSDGAVNVIVKYAEQLPPPSSPEPEPAAVEDAANGHAGTSN